MNKKIAMLGCGSIGSSISADLTKAGYDITIFDQWPAQVEALKAAGLHIQMPDGDLKISVRAHHLCELASLNMEFDIVFLAVKSYDSRWMAELIKPYLKNSGVLVPTQSGMNNDAIDSIIGGGRTLGCALELSAAIFTPGLVQRNITRENTWFAVGEPDGSYTERVREIQSILNNVGRCDVTGNIFGAKWTKLIANTMTAGPHGLLGLKNCEAAVLPGMFDISLNLGRESLAVGVASGYRVDPLFGLRADEVAGDDDNVLTTIVKTLVRHLGSRSRTAPIHDHIKGRRGEIDYINGVVVRKGRELGIPTPYNDAVVEIDRLINTRQVEMDPSNFELLKSKLNLK